MVGMWHLWACGASSQKLHAFLGDFMYIKPVLGPPRAQHQSFIQSFINHPFILDNPGIHPSIHPSIHPFYHPSVKQPSGFTSQPALALLLSAVALSMELCGCGRCPFHSFLRGGRTIIFFPTKWLCNQTILSYPEVNS